MKNKVWLRVCVRSDDDAKFRDLAGGIVNHFDAVTTEEGTTTYFAANFTDSPFVFLVGMQENNMTFVGMFGSGTHARLFLCFFGRLRYLDFVAPSKSCKSEPHPMDRNYQISHREHSDLLRTTKLFTLIDQYFDYSRDAKFLRKLRYYRKQEKTE
jgi:hypothetical protein